jgi:hypothetical protein
MEAFVFTVLFTLLGKDPLELSTGYLPDGRIVVVALTAGPNNTTELHSLIQKQAGENLDASNFTHSQIGAGSIFSISPNLVQAAGYLYMAAVCDFAACIYRLPVNASSWESNSNVAGSALGATPVHSVSLALLGATLAMTLHTPNTLYFMQANPALAIAALNFAVLNTIANVASPFDGGNKASAAINPASGERCLIYRQLVSAVVIGNLVAHCFAGSGSTANIITLAALTSAVGFVNSIETRALYNAGKFYFMYFLAAGTVQLATITDPLTATVAAITQLGLINLALGFPSMALVLGPGAETLYAYWPGNAVAIALATLAVQRLGGFPLQKVGPIAAVLLLTAVVTTVAIFGTGSVAGTIMAPVAEAVPAAPVPFLGLTGLGLLALLMLSLAWWHFRARTASKPDSLS